VELNSVDILAELVLLTTALEGVEVDLGEDLEDCDGIEAPTALAADRIGL